MYANDTGSSIRHGSTQSLQQEEQTEFSEMWWCQHSCLFDEDGSSVTSVCYDEHSELLWAGHGSGRLTSYLSHSEQSGPAGDMHKYSSFTAAEAPITALIPMYQGILSVSLHAVRMHTCGGAGVADFVPFEPSAETMSGANFTTAHILQNYGDSGYAPSSIIAGTDSRFLNIYDMAAPGLPVSMFDVQAPTVKVQSTQLYVAVAGSDGMVRLMDGQLRSPHVVHALSAHSGSVIDMSLPFDSFYFATCGMSGRAINPFDPKSPFIYSPDPVVQVFDVRMLERGTPLSSVSLIPSFVSFLPSVPGAIRRLYGEGDAAPSVMTVSADGCLQVLPVINYDPTAFVPVIASSVVEMGLGEINDLAVSSSGRRIAVGTSSGAAVQLYLQHIVTLDEERDAADALANNFISFSVGSGMVSGLQLDPVINLKSEAVVLPSYPAPSVPRAVSVDDPILATSYTLLSNNSAMLQSSYSSTPKINSTRMRIPAVRKICDDLLSATTFQEFIGFVPNPGFPENSMIYGPSRSKAYQICDPRFVATESGNMAGESGDGLSAQASRGLTGIAAEAHSIPPKYRRVRSHRGKEKMKVFDYHGYNTVSGIVGLENSIERPWINPILQLLFAISRVRRYALESQIRPFHHSITPYSIWCELGLLFHMMSLEETKSQRKGVASASNFHTIFRHSSSAAAVGLLKDTLLYSLPSHSSSGGLTADSANAGSTEGAFSVLGVGSLSANAASHVGFSAESYSVKLQQSIQIFIKFILSELSKESELEAKQVVPSNVSRGGRATSAASSSKNFKSVTASILSESTQEVSTTQKMEDIIDETFGITVHTSTTFLHSGTVDVGNSHRTVSIELIYPPLLSLASSSSSASNKLLVSAKADAKTLESWLSSSKYPYSICLRNRWTIGSLESAPSFCAVLWSSLQKELYMRGWCSTSETYEPFRQIKSVDISDMPTILTVLCGDTLPSAVAASTAVSPTGGGGGDQTSSATKGKESIAGLWRGPNYKGAGPWLSAVIEIFKFDQQGESTDFSSNVSPLLGNSSEFLFVSEKIKHSSAVRVGELSADGESVGNSDTDEWLIYNGISYITAPVPASILFRQQSDNTISNEVVGVGKAELYELFSVVSHIDDYMYSAKRPGVCGTDGNDICCHPVLHIKKPTTSSGDWILLNDFGACKSDILDATAFTSWRHPDALFFIKEGTDATREDKEFLLNKIPESVLSTASLSSVQSIAAVPIRNIPVGTYISRCSDSVEEADKGSSLDVLQAGGLFVAFDAEFVTVQVEETMLDTAGQHVVGRDGRQVVARISLLAEAAPFSSSPAAAQLVPNSKKNGKQPDWNSVISIPRFHGVKATRPAVGPLVDDSVSVPLMLLSDDYVLPPEPVVDYVTRFSGLTSDDLNPAVSSHAIITHRAAVLKLRYYIDNGCIFVGHGLTKDFETANISVPSNQIRDTVELWRLPHQRKISLRFLAAYLLKAEIQDELHDSIEDAKTAYALYLLYEKTLKESGFEGISAILRNLYIYGNQNNWTLGLDRIN